MTEFVGRTGSNRVYSYPEARRNTTVPFARNFAAGPSSNDGQKQPLVVQGIGTPANNAVLWSNLEAGTSPNVLVPITPRSSGLIRISGVLSVINVDALSPHYVWIVVVVDGVPLADPFLEQVTVPNGEAPFAAVPFATETPALAVGVTSTVEILAIADADSALQLVRASSTISLQEVTPATG